jgi:hypothetical protein
VDYNLDVGNPNFYLTSDYFYRKQFELEELDFEKKVIVEDSIFESL